MTDNSIAIAEAYYEAFTNKDIQGIGQRLSPDVISVSPMGTLKGKDAVLVAAERLLPILKSVAIRGRFASGDLVMLAYDMLCVDPYGTCRAAALMTIKGGLITRVELFYDPRPFGAI